MEMIVTGGAGFIGSHLVEELVRKKYKVIVLDNLSTGNLKNLSKFKKKIKFIKCDLSINKNISKYIHNAKYIFHLAGLSKATESFKKSKKYFKANVISTENILNSINKKKLKKFIYTASASCYGNPTEIPTSEKAKIKNLSPYAFTKWTSEKNILKCAKINNFQAISLRLFNVYGPRSPALNAYSGVISIFLKQRIKNLPLSIVGDGNQTRSFIHVSDVVNIMIKCAKSKITGEVFNVGGKETVTINNIVKLIKSKKIYMPKRKGDPRYSSANIKKIKNFFNWKPKISIRKGIKMLLTDSNLKNY